jgi:DUF4097 and DUF4098 domain-containing protein YvlB
MNGYPPGVPPVPPVPPPGYDPRAQRRYLRDQARAQRDAIRAQQQQMRFQMRSMRRGSVLGPILLIAVGVVFLLIQTGRIDHSHFWAWYGHWWPLLLVIAGLVVLGEWFLDQSLLRDPQRPPYRRSLGGGVFVLLIFFVIAGLVANHVHDFPSGYSKMFPGYHFDQDSLDQLFGDKHESDQTLDLAFASGNSLSIVNPRGDVTVSGTSDDNQIHIAVHKQVYARSDSDADSRAEQLSPTTTNEGSTLKITMPSVDGASASLVVTVPAAAATTVNTNHGDIHIASIKAPVTATANHGDVELSAITGPATAHINSGGSSISAHSIDGAMTVQGHAEDITLSDITGPVSINGEFFGTTHLEHINGPAHFHTSRTDLQLARLDGEVEISPDSNLSVDQALGPLALTTRDRTIKLDRISGDIAVTNRNGTIDVTAAPPLGNLTIEDRNGTVKATLPEHAGFTIQASTTNGSIDSSNFFKTTSTTTTTDTRPGTPKEIVENHLSSTGTENSKSLNGVVGAGGPMVRITTSNGDISLLKADVQPLSPAPPATPKITLAPPAAPKTPKIPATPKLPATPKNP